jgi:hypothetical protein
LADFPYVRLVCCELCGCPVSEDQLRRVVLSEAERVNGHFRAARAIRICDRHAEAEPLRAPRDTTTVGTSRLRPQGEALF